MYYKLLKHSKIITHDFKSHRKHSMIFQVLFHLLLITSTWHILVLFYKCEPVQLSSLVSEEDHLGF